MKVIREAITRGAIALPLKEYLVPRFERIGAARNRYGENLHWQGRKSG
jgi:hypothetical protein